MHELEHQVKQKVEVNKPTKSTVTLRAEISKSAYRQARKAHGLFPRSNSWHMTVSDLLELGAKAKLGKA